MIVLGFRLKLLLAMMLVVAGVTIATLYVTQKNVQQTYRKLLDEQFQVQTDFFFEIREKRLGTVKERCQLQADSIRLRAAMEDGDKTVIYSSTADYLQDILGGSVGEEVEAPGNSSRLRATFFRFLDADGHILPPSDSRAGLLSPSVEQRLAE